MQILITEFDKDNLLITSTAFNDSVQVTKICFYCHSINQILAYELEVVLNDLKRITVLNTKRVQDLMLIDRRDSIMAIQLDISLMLANGKN